MNRLTTLLINPVLNKEVKLRFRSFKSYLGIFFYLLILGVIALAFIYFVSNQRYGSMGIRSEESRYMFIVLSMVQMGLISFMTPGLTASAISGEREKQTLNILLTTQQSSLSIILSKLFSSLFYLILIVVASLPLYSLVFLYGGVSPKMLISTFGIFLLTMLTFGSLGVLFSTLIRKTVVSMITTYAASLSLVIGTGLLFFLVSTMFGYYFHGSGQQQDHLFFYLLLSLNPAIVMFSTFEPEMTREMTSFTGIDVPLWKTFAPIYGGISFAAILLAVWRLRPRMKISKRKGEHR